MTQVSGKGCSGHRLKKQSSIQRMDCMFELPEVQSLEGSASEQEGTAPHGAPYHLQARQIPRMDCMIELPSPEELLSGVLEEKSARVVPRHLERRNVPSMDCLADLDAPFDAEVPRVPVRSRSLPHPKQDRARDLPRVKAPPAPAKKGSQRPQPRRKPSGRQDCMFELPLMKLSADDGFDSAVEDDDDFEPAASGSSFSRQTSDEVSENNFRQVSPGDFSTTDTLPDIVAPLPVSYKEISKIARASGWQIICARRGEPFDSLTRHSSKSATACLVLCETPIVKQACAIISNLTSAGERLPVIGMILDENPCLDAVLQAQDALSTAGADDVCLKDIGAEKLRCTIALSIVRAKERMSREMKLKSHARTIDQMRCSMFRTIKLLDPSFPEIHSNGPRAVGHGTQFGEATLLQKLGSGAAGDVYFARNSTQSHDEAVKVINKGDIKRMEQVLSIAAEVDFLRRLQHKSIPSLYSFIQTDAFLVIHMEYAGSRNLYNAIEDAGGILPPAAAQRVTSQVASALAHCHARGVAHCDIKPENISVSSKFTRVALVDFGDAVDVNEVVSGFRGTMPFMAPEVLAGTTYDPAAADVWSLGQVVLEMLCGTRKLNRIMNWKSKGLRPETHLQRELEQVFQNPALLKETLEFDRVAPSHELLSMLRGALDISPRTRWTSKKLSEADWLREARDA